jgi:hypothetical protein
MQPTTADPRMPPAPARPAWPSWLVFTIACLAILATAVFTWPWLQIVRAADGFGAIWFVFILTPIVAGAALLLGVAPAAWLHHKTRAGRDRASFWLALASCVGTCGEAAVLLCVPLRGC